MISMVSIVVGPINQRFFTVLGAETSYNQLFHQVHNKSWTEYPVKNGPSSFGLWHIPTGYPVTELIRYRSCRF